MRILVSCFNPLPGVTPGETLSRAWRFDAHRRFNPLPGVTPGETGPRGRLLERTACFNPLPGVTPGETRGARPDIGRSIVSIRSRVLPREKRESTMRPFASPSRFNPLPGVTPGETVPFVRMPMLSLTFQSAPGCYPGRNAAYPTVEYGGRSGFNPLPGVTPGETKQNIPSVPIIIVSIRSRVLPREKRMICGYAAVFYKFQSAPGCYPGRNVPVPVAPVPPLIGFNPLPGVTPGETGSRIGRCLLQVGFNPLPGVTPGETT